MVPTRILWRVLLHGALLTTGIRYWLGRSEGPGLQSDSLVLGATYPPHVLLWPIRGGGFVLVEGDMGRMWTRGARRIRWPRFGCRSLGVAVGQGWMLRVFREQYDGERSWALEQALLRLFSTKPHSYLFCRLRIATVGNRMRNAHFCPFFFLPPLPPTR